METAEHLDANPRHRQDLGRSLRRQVPRSSHGEWSPPHDRPDPVALIEEQNADRLTPLLAVRRGRMSASPFAFYRGAARVMASDLSTTPTAGLRVQLCGDAHLSNFGAYASPERQLVFDLNDFDETLTGPFEWDVKRLAASFTIAGFHREFDPDTCRALAEAATNAYRLSIADFAERGWLEGWYAHLPVEDIARLAESHGVSKKRVKKLDEFVAHAKSRDRLQAATKLVEAVDGRYRFKSSPPLLVPSRELPSGIDPDRQWAEVKVSLDQYRSSLSEATRLLLDRYQLADVALKVVGVGSVGTRCLVALLVGTKPDDVVLLQVKEATRSVLENHLPASRYRLHGRRVVEGQRLMQATSDIFLGWSSSVSGHHYYWRQLKDWKGSVDLDRGGPRSFERYARLCGWTLARAHAVSGDPTAIADYLGSGPVFDRALGEFAVRYARQNETDHEAFGSAIANGRLEAAIES